MQGEDGVVVAADRVSGQYIAFYVNVVYQGVKKALRKHDFEKTRVFLASACGRQVAAIIYRLIGARANARSVTDVWSVLGVSVVVETELLLIVVYVRVGTCGEVAVKEVSVEGEHARIELVEQFTYDFDVPLILCWTTIYDLGAAIPRQTRGNIIASDLVM